MSFFVSTFYLGILLLYKQNEQELQPILDLLVCFMLFVTILPPPTTQLFDIHTLEKIIVRMPIKQLLPIFIGPIL